MKTFVSNMLLIAFLWKNKWHALTQFFSHLQIVAWVVVVRPDSSPKCPWNNLWHHGVTSSWSYSVTLILSLCRPPGSWFAFLLLPPPLQQPIALRLPRTVPHNKTPHPPLHPSLNPRLLLLLLSPLRQPPSYECTPVRQGEWLLSYSRESWRRMKHTKEMEKEEIVKW